MLNDDWYFLKNGYIEMVNDKLTITSKGIARLFELLESVEKLQHETLTKLTNGGMRGKSVAP